MTDDKKKFEVVAESKADAEKRVAREKAEAAAKAAQVKSPEQLLRDAKFLQGYEKGKHDKGMSNFWHGAIAAFICISIGATFTYLIQGANREQNMIESRVAVGAAISNAKLLGEAEAMKAEVVEEPVK